MSWDESFLFYMPVYAVMPDIPAIPLYQAIKISQHDQYQYEEEF